MGQRTKQIFLQRRHTDGQQTHEKMFNITHYQRNANQNHNEVLSHIRTAAIKKSTNNKCWRGCGEKGTLLHCWWECKLVWDRVLRAGALGWPWWMGWGGRWWGSSGWGTHVHPWLIHVTVCQKPPQYCKVISLQLNKLKIIK